MISTTIPLNNFGRTQADGNEGLSKLELGKKVIAKGI